MVAVCWQPVGGRSVLTLVNGHATGLSVAQAAVGQGQDLMGGHDFGDPVELVAQRFRIR